MTSWKLSWAERICVGNVINYIGVSIFIIVTITS